MIKKATLLIFCIVLLCVHSYADEDHVRIPKNFKIVAVAGGIAPTTPIFKVVINDNAEASYYKMAPTDRKDLLFVKVADFKIDRLDLGILYQRIKEHRFFNLKKEYIAKDISDGSFAELAVTADRKTHTVKTQNTAVKRFDKIMILLNLILPQEYQIIYNEIV